MAAVSLLRRSREGGNRGRNRAGIPPRGSRPVRLREPMPVSDPGIAKPSTDIQPAAEHQARTSDHLRALEAESIHIMREVVAEFERPVMLYSIGKDSSVLLRLAQKAFYPGPIPFPLLHIDTTYKFREMIEF